MDLQRTSDFFDALLTHGSIKDDGKSPVLDQSRRSQVDGGSGRFAQDARFTDPPAPPPQQPLPEKPDGRSPIEATSQPPLKRTDTERPQLLPLGSPSRGEAPHQVGSLMDALASANREIASQSARVKTLEDVLQEERSARRTAEDRARRLEKEQRLSGRANEAEDTTDALDGVIDIRAPCVDVDIDSGTDNARDEALDVQDRSSERDKMDQSTARLQQRLDVMVAEMGEMKQVMERYRRRAEAAEEESASSRASLAEMVEKIRTDEGRRGGKERDYAIKIDTTTERKPQTSACSMMKSSGNMLGVAGIQNGKPPGPAEVAALERAVSSALAQPRRRQDQLLQSAPYASILGVVVLGMGVMALLNGWQKVDR